MNYNKVILVGNLTRDPQLSYLPSQTPVCEFGLAVNRRWNAKDGTKKEETCFIDCTGFGKQAETLQKYVHKGDPILIEGRLQFDRWEGPDGTKHSKHRVVVENFQFLGKGDVKPAPQAAPAPEHDPNALYEADGGDNSEIPF